MGVRDWNIDPDYSQFARKLVALQVNIAAGASTATTASIGSFVTPFAGVMLSVVVDARVSSGSVVVGVRKNGTVQTTASVSTTGTAAIAGMVGAAVVDGDAWDVVITHDQNQRFVGGVTFELRPQLFSSELGSPVSNA